MRATSNYCVCLIPIVQCRVCCFPAVIPAAEADTVCLPFAILKARPRNLVG